MAEEPVEEPESGLLTKGGRLFVTNCRDRQPIIGPKDDPCDKNVNENCCGCGNTKNYCECANPPCFFSYSGNSYVEWEDQETYQKLFLCDGANPSGYGMINYSGGVNSWWGWYGGWWGYSGWNWWWGWGWGWGWGWYGGWWGWWSTLLPGQENTGCTPALRWKTDFYRKWFCGDACYVYMTWAHDSCSSPWGVYEVTEAGEACKGKWRGCCPTPPDDPCGCGSSSCQPDGCYGWWWGYYSWSSTHGCHCWTYRPCTYRQVNCYLCGECEPCWGGQICEDWGEAKYGSCYKGNTSSSVARLILWDCETGGWSDVTSQAFEIVDGTQVAAGQWNAGCNDVPEDRWGRRWKLELSGGIKTSSQSRPGHYNCITCEGYNPCGVKCIDPENPFTYCSWPEECEPRLKPIEEYATVCPEPPDDPDNPDCPEE
jgi:hypothetical protein